MTNSELQKRIDLLENRVKALEKKQEPQHHEFKVGDRVQFKSWDEMEKEFGLDRDGDICLDTSFTFYMKHLCENYATIEEIDGKYVKLKDFSTNEDIDFNYTIDMLKPATDEPKCKFKVGDKVKVIRGENKGEIVVVRDIGYNAVSVVTLDGSCTSVFDENYLEPYTEPRWTFTDDEKVILRNLPKEYKWIARDENHQLYVYHKEPYRDIDEWATAKHDYDCIEFYFYCDLFQSIKWSDDQPCEFRKYL